MENLISVIVNCHNGEKYLKKCISSILNQKFKNFEIIFYDNCSSDDSKKIIESFKSKKIKYFFNEKKLSLYQARNEAIKKCSGSLVAFLDTDDWWDENYLSSKEKFFEKNEYDFFYSNVLFYYEKNKIFKKYKNFNLPDGIIYEYLVKDYFIIISGLIIKKKILEKELYFNENYNIIGDFDLMMKVSKYANAKGFNDTYVCYRVHQKNFSKLNNRMFFEEYKNWLGKQFDKHDSFFDKHKKYFINKLNRLEIIFLLYEKKSFYLILKIFKEPDIFLKIKFLLAFFIPSKLIKYFRK